jgi:hypothetical protein
MEISKWQALLFNTLVALRIIRYQIVIGAALLQIVYLFYISHIFYTECVRASAFCIEQHCYLPSRYCGRHLFSFSTHTHTHIHTRLSRIWCYALLTFLNNKDLLSVRSLTPSDTHTHGYGAPCVQREEQNFINKTQLHALIYADMDTTDNFIPLGRRNEEESCLFVE